MPGGYDIVKHRTPRKKQSNDEAKAKALARIETKIGKDEMTRVQEEFKKHGSQDKSKQDGMIVTLVALGLSGNEIKALLGIGGYRTARLQKMSKMTEEMLASKERAPPSHK